VGTKGEHITACHHSGIAVVTPERERERERIKREIYTENERETTKKERERARVDCRKRGDTHGDQ